MTDSLTEFDDVRTLERHGRALVTIEGLWCPSCAAATERLLRDTRGVKTAQVSFVGSAALLHWDPAQTSLEQLARKVHRLGYRLGPPRSSRTSSSRLDNEIRALGIRLTLAVFFGAWTMLLSLLLYLDVGQRSGETVAWWLALASSLFALPVLILAGRPIFLAGWRTLRTGIPGMDTLVSLGVLAATGLSVWQLAQGSDQVFADTAVMLITLLTVGRLLETRALRRAAATIDALHARLPEVADRIDADGQTETVPAEMIAHGDLIRVQAGQRVPLDGVIHAGETSLDRAVLTGESQPIPIRPGERVLAGSVNLDRAVTMRVDGPVGEREIDRIGERVLETVRSRPGTQQLADRVARWIAPTAIALASLTIVLGWHLGLPLDDTLLRATSVLVVACPCAVSIAVPIAYVSIAGRAADEGVLFRDAAVLERLAGVDTLYLDKTGTLTEGRPAVAEVIMHQPPPASLGSDPIAVIRLAAAAESGVEHVIADALRRAAGDQPFPPLDARRGDAGVSAHHPALGEVLVGSPRFLREHGVPVTDEPADHMRVEMAVAGRWVASIVFDDPVRPAAAATIRHLRRRGIDCGLITGDRREPALRVANEVGIDAGRVHADCLPADKAELIRDRGGRVAFVGDGANDALALATADAGIAVANANSTAAMAAGVVLGEEGITGVSRAVELARRGRRLMRQNIGFAVAYNAAGLTLATLGAIPPVVAAAAMAASSLTVIANAARHGWRTTAQPTPPGAPSDQLLRQTA